MNSVIRKCFVLNGTIWNQSAVSLVAIALVATVMVAVSTEFYQIKVNKDYSTGGEGWLNVHRGSSAVPPPAANTAEEAMIVVGYGNTLRHDDDPMTTNFVENGPENSIAVGALNTAQNNRGDGSALIGSGNYGAAMYQSAAIGKGNSAIGHHAFSIGYDNEVYQIHSNPAVRVVSSGAAIGVGLYVKNQEACTAVGRYNTKYEEADAVAFAVGTGTSDHVDDRESAFEVHLNGDVVLSRAQGDIAMGSFGP